MPTSTTISHEQTNLPQERERFGVEEERITDPLVNSDAFGQESSDSESLMSAPGADFSMVGNASAEMSAAVAPVQETIAPVMPLAGEDFSMEEEPMASMEEILELSPVASPSDENNSMNGNASEPGDLLDESPEEPVAEESEEAETEEVVPEEESGQSEESEEQELVLQPPKRRPITEPFPTSTEEDPAFTTTSDQVATVAEAEATTNPATQDVAAAQLAAPTASNEEMGNAQRQQVTDMQEQETGTFDAEAFKEKLLKRIKDMSLPSNLEQADNFDDNNNIDSVRRSAMSDVATQEESAAGPLRETTAERPDPQSVPQREVAELPEQPVGENPEPVPASEGMPAPRPDSHIQFPLEDDMNEVRYEFDSNEITDEQLTIANEPTFTHALESKEEVQENIESAPDRFREDEQEQLEATQATADTEAQRQTEAMHTARVRDLASVTGEQETAGQNDSEERRKVAADIKTIYDQTKTNVEKILNDLKEDVKTKFDSAAASAKSKFENHVARRFRDYKNERYSGPTGALKWGKDKLFDMPSEVNVFFTEGRGKYISSMDASLTVIANYVATQLTAAKTEIRNGQKKVKEYVDKLPTNLRNVGTQAAQDIQNEFDKLTSSVEDAQDELIDSLAQQYVENLAQVDQRIEQMKEENKGLVTKAKEAVEKVIDVVTDIKNTLSGLLAAALSAIGAIVADPIGFLSNLISGIAEGFTNFGKNIVSNITTGLITWLTGSLGGLGIQVPENVLSLSGMFDLATQVLGLTWDYFRQKAVKLLGERVVSAMETGVEIFKIVKKDGMQGLWEHIKAEFADLKSMVMDAIRDMIITKVIEAGIKWILGLMSPAGAFIKAAMMIIDIVKFFIERGSQILELVNAFIEGIKAIAGGNVAAVAKAIENALIKAIPVLIGFLAALAGVTGLTSKVQKLIERLRNRIDKAIDKIILKAKRVFGNLVQKGKAKVKGIVEKLFGWARVKKRFTAKDGSKHTLYFEKKGRKPVLYMASLPTSLKEVIERSSMDDPVKERFLARLKEINEEISTETAHADSKTNAEEAQRHHDNIHKNFQTKINDLADEIAPFIGESKLPPTTVTHQADGEGRTNRLIADPLSLNPGNTKGGEADGNREHATGFRLIRKWEEKTLGRTGIEQSRVTATHILPAGLHGPYKKGWNVPLADQGLNNSMKHKGGANSPENIALRHFRNTQLRYVVDVTYFNNNKPPDEAYTVENANTEKVANWVGFFIVEKFKILIQKWDGEKYSNDALYKDEVKGKKIPVKGQETKSLDALIIDLLKKSKIAGETKERDGFIYTKTALTSNVEIAGALVFDKNKVVAVTRLLQEGDHPKVIKAHRTFYIREDL